VKKPLWKQIPFWILIAVNIAVITVLLIIAINSENYGAGLTLPFAGMSWDSELILGFGGGALAVIDALYIVRKIRARRR